MTEQVVQSKNKCEAFDVGVAMRDREPIVDKVGRIWFPNSNGSYHTDGIRFGLDIANIKELAPWGPVEIEPEEDSADEPSLTETSIDYLECLRNGDTLYDTKYPGREYSKYDQGYSVRWEEGYCGNDYPCAEILTALLERRVSLEKPEPREMPSIDWSHVAQEFEWLAIDNDGSATLFEKSPQMIDNEWDSEENFLDATAFASFKRGNVPWNESLVKRPDGV